MNSNDDKQLAAARNTIDQIDQQLHQLLSDRASAAQEVARIKLAADPNAVFYRPEREAAILSKVKERNTGPIPDEAIAKLFREIMSLCLSLEQPMHVAFLGPKGTFTQAAAIKHFGHAVQTHSLTSIPDVFRDVESGNCHYGVVPVENSTEGVVSHTLDMFIKSNLKICGEVSLRINHNLLTDKNIDLDDVSKVYSHQQSLAQCRGWLDTHLPRADRIAVASNAEAAQMIMGSDNSAAIASETAGEIYSLRKLAENIEDEPCNTTRFLIIGKQDVAPSGNDKTSLLLTTKNESGGLHSLLTPFANHHISMSRIESRPSRQGIWDYVFFVDVDGHKEDADLAEALADLKNESNMCKVLGSYPKAVI